MHWPRCRCCSTGSWSSKVRKAVAQHWPPIPATHRGHGGVGCIGGANCVPCYPVSRARPSSLRGGTDSFKGYRPYSAVRCRFGERGDRDHGHAHTLGLRVAIEAAQDTPPSLLAIADLALFTNDAVLMRCGHSASRSAEDSCAARQNADWHQRARALTSHVKALPCRSAAKTQTCLLLGLGSRLPSHSIPACSELRA